MTRTAKNLLLTLLAVSLLTVGVACSFMLNNVTLTPQRPEHYEQTGSWGGPGSGNGQFSVEQGPTGIAIANGQIYVADSGNKRIQEFKTTGEFVDEYPLGYYPQDIEYDGYDVFYIRTNDGLEQWPMNFDHLRWSQDALSTNWSTFGFGICIDSERNILVPVSLTQNGDPKKSQMRKYDPIGNKPPIGYGGDWVRGASNCEADKKDGSIYVSIGDSRKLEKFNKDGTHADTIHFDHSIGAMAIDAQGNLFLYFSDLKVIRKFDEHYPLRPLAKFEGPNHDEWKFLGVHDIEIDNEGSVYVSDGGADGGKIYVFQQVK